MAEQRSQTKRRDLQLPLEAINTVAAVAVTDCMTQVVTQLSERSEAVHTVSLDTVRESVEQALGNITTRALLAVENDGIVLPPPPNNRTSSAFPAEPELVAIPPLMSSHEREIIADVDTMLDSAIETESEWQDRREI